MRCAAQPENHSVLMKVNAHLIRRAKMMEVCEEAKAMTDIFKEFFAKERLNSSQNCLLCERGSKRDSAPECKCGYQVMTTKRCWSHELADTLKDSVYLLKDIVSIDVTSPTPVSLVTSLACFSLLSCKESLDNLERGREIFALTAANFHGFVRGKDAKCPMLRKNLGNVVAETDKTYLFNKESRELSLTQQDEVKSNFPTHLVLIDSATGQILIDQMFPVPKIVDSKFMSVTAFRRFRRLTYHYRTPEKGELWKKAVGIPFIRSW